MASRSKTPTFVSGFETVADQSAYKIFDARLEAGRQLYNATLGESKRRCAAMCRDPAWTKAKAMPRETKEQRTVRAEAFWVLKEKYGFTLFSLLGLADKPKKPKSGEKSRSRVQLAFGKKPSQLKLRSFKQELAIR